MKKTGKKNTVLSQKTDFWNLMVATATSIIENNRDRENRETIHMSTRTQRMNEQLLKVSPP